MDSEPGLGEGERAAGRDHGGSDLGKGGREGGAGFGAHGSVGQVEIKVVDQGSIGADGYLVGKVEREGAGSALDEVVEGVREGDGEDGVENLKLGCDEAGGVDRAGGREVGCVEIEDGGCAEWELAHGIFGEIVAEIVGKRAGADGIAEGAEDLG